MMEEISEYPVKFEMEGVQLELNKNMLRKVLPDGTEEKTSFDIDIIGYDLSDEHKEYLIVLEGKDEFYCISKKNGWFGPFKEVRDISYEEGTGISVVETEEGKAVPLKRE